MLRMQPFQLERPTTVAEALRLLTELGENTLVVAGGTDALPNIKHELFTPEHVVSLADVEELRGIHLEDDGTLVLGAMTTVDAVSKHGQVLARVPALAQACGLIAGPQLRRMGTIGGNVLLDTRCQWYNQTYFWREALGFCLKKDGSKCHVVESGSKCVAAASNDSAAALMTLGAELVIASHTGGERRVKLEDFWRADGIFNKKIQGHEILTSIRIPQQAKGHRGAYGKLRDRGAIDYPLLGVAVRVDLDDSGAVSDADVVVIALQARPVRIKKASELLQGHTPGSEAFATALEDLAAAAHKQCHPMPNIPGDHDYRREMVPVFVRRTVQAAASESGPVHHV